MAHRDKEMPNGCRSGWVAVAVAAAVTPFVLLAVSSGARAQPKPPVSTTHKPAANTQVWPPATPDANGYIPEGTIAEIMTSIVMPSAQILWDAVSVDVTEKGEVQKVPQTDEDWEKLRWTAMTLVEATNLLIIPGRHVDEPGVKSANPDSELGPDQIAPLIAKDRAAWIGHAHVLQAAAMQALKAVDARSVDGISEAGGTIDTACETCHLQFWYPNQQQP
jgi:cytochrome c556